MLETLKSIIVQEFDPVFGYWYMAPVIIFYILAASYTDAKQKKIYDKLNISLLILRLVSASIYPITSRHLIGAIFGLLIILIPAMIMNIPMGGDIKFAAVLGLWISDSGIYVSLAIGAILFIIYGLAAKKKRKEMVPLGPFISIGCLCIMVIYYALALPYILEYAFM